MIFSSYDFEKTWFQKIMILENFENEVLTCIPCYQHMTGRKTLSFCTLPLSSRHKAVVLIKQQPPASDDEIKNK
jgi:hypothetical protein